MVESENEETGISLKELLYLFEIYRKLVLSENGGREDEN
jgi:hypothetical protein